MVRCSLPIFATRPPASSTSVGLPVITMVNLFALALVLSLAQLTHSECVPAVLHPQTAMCNQKLVFKGKIISKQGNEEIGYSYLTNVLEIIKNRNSFLSTSAVVNLTTKGSMQNGITGLEPEKEYFITSGKTNDYLPIDICQSYVKEWNELPLPESVYEWSVADDTFRPSWRCKKCQINFGETPKNDPGYCDFYYGTYCHMYERCYYDSDNGQCSWGKLPQKIPGLDCEEGTMVEEGAEE
ncbi:uncharacterized protein [Argopecten irradians]|uniref:uncharacterized protein n=1 Tax=Argopecten irradians TaxID=31199 RepID=UPI003716AC15